MTPSGRDGQAFRRQVKRTSPSTAPPPRSGVSPIPPTKRQLQGGWIGNSLLVRLYAYYNPSDPGVDGATFLAMGLPSYEVVKVGGLPAAPIADRVALSFEPTAGPGSPVPSENLDAGWLDVTRRTRLDSSGI